MRKILKPSADTTLYQRIPTNNSGLDEILEVGKLALEQDVEVAYSSSAARILLNYDLSDSGSVPISASYFLNLRIANASKLSYSQNLLVYKVSSSWTEGSGYYLQQIKNSGDGATWNQSSTSVSWSSAGGDYYTSSFVSVILDEYPLQDLRINVSSIVQPIVSSSLVHDASGSGTILPWNGLLVKYPNASETDFTNEGNIKFFSKQTHTVYAPTLEIAWDDSTFITGSILKPIPSALDLEIIANNVKQTYIQGTIQQVKFIVRDKYPLKNFDSTLRYKNRYYLPSTSYISIVDAQSDTVIVAADNFSRVSCDGTNSYFILDTTPLYKNRYYTVNLTINNGSYDKCIIPDIFTFLVK